jgi:hypothetical protein
MPYLYIGAAAALITGVGLPASIFLFGNVLNSFAQLTPTGIEHMVNTVKKIALVFTVIGIIVWFTAYIYFSFLLIFSQRVA